MTNGPLNVMFLAVAAVYDSCLYSSVISLVTECTKLFKTEKHYQTTFMQIIVEQFLVPCNTIRNLNFSTECFPDS